MRLQKLWLCCVAALLNAASARKWPSQPTQVLIVPRILSINDINPAAGSFYADVNVIVAYTDTTDSLPCTTIDEMDPKKIFVPAIEMANAVGGRGSTRLALELLGNTAGAEDPNLPFTCVVSAAARFGGVFTSDFDLRAFPFDKQSIRITLREWYVNASLAHFAVVGNVSDVLPQGYAIDGWQVLGTSVEVETETLSIEDQYFVYSTVVLTVRIKRDPTYYITRAVANIVMLVIMGIFVLCIHPMEADRLGFVQSSFIAVISWLFVLVNDTPRVGYLTRLDTFVNASFATLFSVFIFNALHAAFFKTIDRWLVRIDRKLAEQAKALDAGTSPLRASIRWLPSMAGTWVDTNPHRRMDVMFGVSAAIAYLIASAWILGRPS